jgi:hypothetical protein
MNQMAGAMPTLAVGMREKRENHNMPTASVGMAACNSLSATETKKRKQPTKRRSPSPEE